LPRHLRRHIRTLETKLDQAVKLVHSDSITGPCVCDMWAVPDTAPIHD